MPVLTYLFLFSVDQYKKKLYNEKSRRRAKNIPAYVLDTMETIRQQRKLDVLEPKDTWVAYKGDLVPESKFRRRAKERKREQRERGESGTIQGEITPPGMIFLGLACICQRLTVILATPEFIRYGTPKPNGENRLEDCESSCTHASESSIQLTLT